MKRSKFLKKSLAALLSLMLIVAMIPVGAAAAGGPDLVKATVTVGGAPVANVKMTTTSVTADVPTDVTGLKVTLLVEADSVSWATKTQSYTAAKEVDPEDTTQQKTVFVIAPNPDEILSLTEGNVITIVATATKAGVSSTITITLTKTETANPSENTDIERFEVTSAQTVAGADDFTTVQYDETHAHIYNGVINITVPYKTDRVYLRYLHLGDENSKVTADCASAGAANGTTLTPEVQFDTDRIEEAPLLATFTSDAQRTRTFTITVKNGGATKVYTVNITKNSGFVDNKVTFEEEVIDSVVLPGEKYKAGTTADGTIVVLLPYGTTTRGTAFTLTPKAVNLDYPSATLSRDTTWASTGKVTAPATSIESSTWVHAVGDDALHRTVNDTWLDWVDYTSGKAAWSTMFGRSSFAANNCVGQLTVNYVEGDSITYDVYIVEPTLNNKADIESMITNGGYEAEVDKDAKTVTVTLPNGERIRDVRSQEFKASGDAKVTVPLQPEVKIDGNDTTDRAKIDTYTQTGSLNCTGGAIIRVESEDGLTVNNYTVNASTVMEFVHPELTGATLTNGSNSYKADPDELAEGIVHFTLPYQTKLSADLSGWTFSYFLTPGAQIKLTDSANPAKKNYVIGAAGTDTWLDRNDTDYFGNKKADGVDRQGKATSADIVVKAENPETEAFDQSTYKVIIDYADAGQDTSAKVGVKSRPSSMDGAINPYDYTYEGSAADGFNYVVEIPWSHFQMASNSTTKEMYDYLHSLLPMITTNDPNAKVFVWNKLNTNHVLLEVSDAGQMWQVDASGKAITDKLFEETGKAPKDDTNCLDQTNTLTFYVLSEKEWVDLVTTGRHNYGVRNNAGIYIGSIASENDLGTQSDKTWQKYTITVHQRPAEVQKNLASITVSSLQGWCDVQLTVNPTTHTITGSLPYAFVRDGGKLTYKDSNRAWVLGVDENINLDDPVANVNAEDKIPGFNTATGYTTRFYQNGIGSPTLSFTESVQKKGMLDVHINGVTDVLDNKLAITNESGSGKLDIYTLELTVEKAHTGTEIASFELEDKDGNTVSTYADIKSVDGGTGTITVHVPYGTEYTYLIPQYTLATDSLYGRVHLNGTAVLPNGNNTAAFNFTTPRSLVVNSEKGDHTSTYSVVVVEGQQFPDVAKGTWYFEHVHEAADAELVKGFPDGTFQPMKTTTRAEMAVMVAHVLGVNTDIPVTTVFDDCTADWYSAAIAYGYENGYLAGRGDNKFAPDAPITRQEMAQIIAKALQIHGKTTGKYVDDAKIAKWAYDAVYAVKEYNIMVGDVGGTFRPNDTLTRAEAAATVVQVLHYLNK